MGPTLKSLTDAEEKSAQALARPPLKFDTVIEPQKEIRRMHAKPQARGLAHLERIEIAYVRIDIADV